MEVPTNPIRLMTTIYRDVLPTVHKYLAEWENKANDIPNDELRKQALLSINSKTFHCEGGAIYSILAHQKMSMCIQFVIAYQTISDYLDNLCDRSTSLDPDDFRALHESMFHALTPGEKQKNYYRHREDQDDGGYLTSLVKTCQDVLKEVPHYEKIAPVLHELAGYYCDLQVHKHVKVDERVPRLQKWYDMYKSKFPAITWYEFSACAGSTLGIFCLVSYAFQENFKQRYVGQIRNGLFPYVQGLHILLDYFIDQDEDRIGGDLNFCFYYRNHDELVRRLLHFVKEADQSVKGLPNETFHLLINRGLLGIYLSDKKVKQQKKVNKMAKKMVRFGGMPTLFFYLNGMVYRKLKS